MGPEAAGSSNALCRSAQLFSGACTRTTMPFGAEKRSIPRDLFENEAGNSDSGIFVIPFRRKMFDADLERAALARGKRRGVSPEQVFRIPQNYLMERIAKLDGNIHGLNVAYAIVGHRSRDVGKFLVQKIRGLSQLQIGEVYALGVGLFGGSKRQLRRSSRTGRMDFPREQEYAPEQNQYDNQAGGERDRESASVFAVRAFAWFHVFFRSCYRPCERR